MVDLGFEPRSLGYYLGNEERFIHRTVHIVLRGAYLPGTVRCADRGSTSVTRPTLGMRMFRHFAPVQFIYCYVDVRVNAYILGSSPPTLTVLVHPELYWEGESPDAVEELRSSIERVLVEGGFHYRVSVSPRAASLVVKRSVPRPVARCLGRVVVGLLDLGRGAAGGTRHGGRRSSPPAILGKSTRLRLRRRLSVRLGAGVARLRPSGGRGPQARVTEYGGRIFTGSTFPMLVTDTNQLRQYTTEVGAYNHPVPPPCGLSVLDQASNPRLMLDCIALLDGKDALRGRDGD